MGSSTQSAFSLFVLSAALAGCASQGVQRSTAAPAGIPPPKLVVFMVVDGFPQEQVTKYYDQLSEGG